jgi:hypothetical protein
VKEIPRDTQKWENLFDKYDKKNSGPKGKRANPARHGGERINRHKGGGISRSTLARMVEEDLDGDE